MKRLDFCQNTKSPIFGSSSASNISSQKLGLIIFLTLRVCNFMQKNQKKNPIPRSGTANGLTNKQMNSTKFIEDFHWCRCPRNNSTDEFSSASSKTGGWFIVCTAPVSFSLCRFQPECRRLPILHGKSFKCSKICLYFYVQLMLFLNSLKAYVMYNKEEFNVSYYYKGCSEEK